MRSGGPCNSSIHARDGWMLSLRPVLEQGVYLELYLFRMLRSVPLIATGSARKREFARLKRSWLRPYCSRTSVIDHSFEKVLHDFRSTNERV